MVKIISPTAAYLEKAIRLSGKTQREIADEIGLPRPNSLSMMKLGTCKVPIERIPALAKACGVSSLPFVKTALQEYHPELIETLETVAGGYLTAHEVEWLGIYRGLTKRGAFDVDSKLWLDVYQFLEELLERRRS
jgi:transcriptional regulator with XRE-family HTH domain